MPPWLSRFNLGGGGLDGSLGKYMSGRLTLFSVTPLHSMPFCGGNERAVASWKSDNPPSEGVCIGRR